MPKRVTDSELQLINERFAKEPLTTAYMIPMRAADTSRWVDSRSAKLAPSSITKYAADAKAGVPMMLNHFSFLMPMGVGKVFDGADHGGLLFLKSYMPIGATIPNAVGGTVSTDDVAAAYDAGLADKVSIGFTFEKAECNLCTHDVRSPECIHMPGKAYKQADGLEVECVPTILAGEKGKLMEVSLVWQGAIGGAKTVKPEDLPKSLQAAHGGTDPFSKGTVVALSTMTLMVPLTVETPHEEESETVLAFTHNSTLARSEPSWGSVDKTKLPQAAFADHGEADKKSTWGYPHHWVQNGGNEDANGIYTTGTMYLHRGGLRAAKAAAGGARSGQGASAEVKTHLDEHAKAIGMGQNQLRFLEAWTFDPDILVLNPVTRLLDELSEEDFGLIAQCLEDEETMGAAVIQALHDSLQDQITEAKVELSILKARLTAQEKLVAIGTARLTELKDAAMKAGVQAMGNAFKTDFYGRLFEQAVLACEPGVITEAKETWEAEAALRFPVGRRSEEPPVADSQVNPAVSLGSPSEEFDRLAKEEMKAREWGPEKYGDACSIVGKKRPELVEAMRHES